MDNFVSGDINKTGGLQKELEIFYRARVMLRSKINIEQGLINGLTMGIITELVWPLFRCDQIYDTDIPSVRIDFGKDGVHLIKPKSMQFSALPEVMEQYSEHNFHSYYAVSAQSITCKDVQ
ncbi:uncharacterized protein TNCT_83681 [Trichonephila clavata]|uniref:Uncharacterized protein n=1 Tax=Trichonephila clavata TaxID=2740835 RepID=A0A8X6KQ80_TRICU|nr:uncharacterized protein TNCT_83681 [Trichonephila clavata]